MIQLTLPAEVDRLGIFLEVVEQFARDLAFSPSRIQKVVLVMEEAILNIVNHAYGEETGEVEVRCWEEEDAMAIELRDRGRPFDPLSMPDPDLSRDVMERPIGGLGLLLIRRIADKVSYRREGDCNVLTIILQRET